MHPASLPSTRHLCSHRTPVVSQQPLEVGELRDDQLRRSLLFYGYVIVPVSTLFLPLSADDRSLPRSEPPLTAILYNIEVGQPVRWAAPTTSDVPGVSEDWASKLSQQRAEQDSEDKCMICLDSFKMGDAQAAGPCHHWFHVPCIGDWITVGRKCPCCRRDLFNNVHK